MLPALVASDVNEAVTMLASLPVLHPPSPYHPKVRRQSAAHATVLPALFHAKMDSQLRRRPVQHVMERAERKLRASARRPQLERGPGSTAVTTDATTQPVLPQLVVADGNEKGAAARAVTVRHADSLSLYHLQDSQRQEFGAWERQARQELMAQAELNFTRCSVAFLRELQLVVAREEEAQRGTAPAAGETAPGATVAAEVMADTARRAEARAAYMNAIAATAQRQVSERHTAEKLRAKMTALLPEHAAGREQILADEVAALRELLDYDRKHHPRGPGCFAIVRDGPKTNSDPTPASKAKRGGQRAAIVVAKSRRKDAEVTATQSHLEKLRHRPYHLREWLGEDDVMRDATAAEEMCYAAEGRTLFQREKERQAEAYRRTHAVRDLLASEVAARTALRLQESQEWMPLLARAVDGVYEAAQHTRRRLAREAAEREQAASALVDDVLRAALKAHMCRQHRAEQQRAYDAEAEEEIKKAARETTEAPLTATATTKPRFAALDLVMRVAMADSTVSMLHNDAFASLAAAECMIGDAEHTKVSAVARQFAAAQSTSLTPAYLGAALWHTDLDETLVLSQLSLPAWAAPRCDATTLRAFLRELCTARMEIVREQMGDVLTLYKRAAVERAALTAAEHRTLV